MIRRKTIEAHGFATCPPLRAAAVLRVAGSDAPACVEALQARARRAGLADRLEWLGHVTGARKAAAFAETDLFVLPSFSENIGMAAVEAMLAGLPCLLSLGIAVARLAAQAGAARLVKPDRLGMPKPCWGLYSSHGRRGSWAGGCAFARSAFSTKATADRVIELYRGLVRGEKAKRA